MTGWRPLLFLYHLFVFGILPPILVHTLSPCNQTCILMNRTGVETCRVAKNKYFVQTEDLKENELKDDIKSTIKRDPYREGVHRRSN